MKFQSGYLSVTSLLVLVSFSAKGEAVNVNEGIGELKNLVNAFNFNFEDGLPTVAEFFQKLMGHCQKNNVNIDLKSLLSAYSCLGQLNNTLGDEPSDDPLSDSLYEKICTQWPETKECINPIVKKMELCLFVQFMDVEGVLMDILDTLKKPFCTADNTFFDGIVEDIPPTFNCMSKYTKVIIADAVLCFTRTPEHTKQTISETSDSKQICKNFDHYIKCFEESFDVCNNPRVGKLVYRLIEELGFKKMFYNRIFRCS